MTLDDYLQYIKQEALAAPRRSAVRGGRQSSTAFSVGRRSLISSFIRRLSQALASLAGKWRKHVVSGKQKGREMKKRAVGRIPIYV